MQDKSNFSLAGHPVRLVHATSGRIRLKAIAPTETVLSALSARLKQVEGVYEVESKRTTGSLIVWFNASRLTALELLENLTSSPDSAYFLEAPNNLDRNSTNRLENLSAIALPRGTVRTGILKGLRGGTLKCCLAVFARYSLSELVEHSCQESAIQSSPPKRSVWQRLKAIAR